MPLSGLDTAAIARCLSQVADREGDHADAYFERLEEVEIRVDGSPGVRCRTEGGFAIRLVRGESSWSVTGDRLENESLTRGMRRVARARPPAPALVPPFRLQPIDPGGLDSLRRFPAAVVRGIRRLHTAFPLELTVRRHRRWVQVVGTRLVPAVETETFYSCSAELPWGGYGALLTELDRAAANRVAEELAESFAARQAPSPEAFDGAVVMAPAAAAVFLHEAVAHVLETDSLALTGRPEAAIGVRLGSSCLDVLDDPGSAPAPVRRTSDDEGSLVQRRWLLRGGVVDQLLADGAAARRSAAVAPGAGRRSDRHQPPVPRSSHLELLPGESDESELLAGADGGLRVSRAASGSVDPRTGRFVLSFPYARRIRNGALAEWTGPCRLVGQVADVLGAVAAVGSKTASTGGGWCAKDGQRMPVWATTPGIRVDGARIESP